MNNFFWRLSSSVCTSRHYIRKVNVAQLFTKRKHIFHNRTLREHNPIKGRISRRVIYDFEKTSESFYEVNFFLREIHFPITFGKVSSFCYSESTSCLFSLLAAVLKCEKTHEFFFSYISHNVILILWPCQYQKQYFQMTISFIALRIIWLYTCR